MKNNLDSIVRVAIHPAIGISRVGNSTEKDGYVIGPEVPNPQPYADGPLKDKKGAIKRQAARFRLYGFDKDGKVVCEITEKDANIEWRVEIANKKAGWYNFNEALDLPQAPAVTLRNANFEGKDRKKLDIKPDPKTISGANQQGKKYQFDDGKFMGTKVNLGELRTDEAGRLLFLGGYGHSATPYPNNAPYTFDNNDGWHDDTSDGTVDARVKIGNKLYEAEQAWVVCAPPNYGTSLVGVKTMYDVMEDLFINAQWKAFPPKLLFTQHVLPILIQYSDAQWVNYGFHVGFGFNSAIDFTNKSFLEKLSVIIPIKDVVQQESFAKTDVYQQYRRELFNMFRQPAADEAKIEKQYPMEFPWMYGDTITLGANQDSHQYLAMTGTQLKILEKWVAGEVENDLDLSKIKGEHVNLNNLIGNHYGTLDQYPLQNQPHVMDHANLHFCLGGAFHPGCEMTWPMRNSTMYTKPFRIRPRSSNNPEPDYGATLDNATVTGDNGPLYFNAPGDITRWMAVPWQSDTASCRAGYEPNYDPYLPTFWPARVPNHVLSMADYKKVMNTKLSREERLAAFNNRAAWLRGLEGQYLTQVDEMIDKFGTLGIVEAQPGIPNDPDFPATMFVETGIGYDDSDIPQTRNLTAKRHVRPNDRVNRDS